MCFLCILLHVILVFMVILNQVLYNITIHIENSIDIPINIYYFEIENGHFSQTGDNFGVCLLKCPSVGIWRVLFAHLLYFSEVPSKYEISGSATGWSSKMYLELLNSCLIMYSCCLIMYSESSPNQPALRPK
jgi:hypothetical protein